MERLISLSRFLRNQIWLMETTDLMMKQNRNNPNNKREGNCHVCGNWCTFSFEHIPPKSAGNTSRAKIYSGVDLIERQGFEPITSLEGLYYDQQQQGTGVYSLCESCNNYFGRYYVEAYSEAHNATRLLFSENPYDDTVNATVLQTNKMHVLAFFKHVLSSFCATTQYGSMLDCKNFLLDHNSNAFPNRFKLFMFAIPDTSSKGVRSGWQAVLGKPSYTVAHLFMPPFGFSLYETTEVNDDVPYFGCNITNFAFTKWNEYPFIHLELRHAKGNVLLPFDRVD